MNRRLEPPIGENVQWFIVEFLAAYLATTWLFLALHWVSSAHT